MQSRAMGYEVSAVSEATHRRSSCSECTLLKNAIAAVYLAHVEQMRWGISVAAHLSLLWVGGAPGSILVMANQATFLLCDHWMPHCK